MKNRVHCEQCKSFKYAKFDKKLNFKKKAKCKEGHRVMFRAPVNPGLERDYGYIRYCSDFKKRLLSYLGC